MKNRSSFIILSFLLLPLPFCKDGKDRTGLFEKETLSISVVTKKAERKTIRETIWYPGILEPFEKADVGPSMSGHVRKILVKEGDLVKKGQVVAMMDSKTLTQAEAQFRTFEKDMNRFSSLRESDTITPQSFERIEAGYKSAKATYEMALENTEIRSPLSGVVWKIYKKEGEFLLTAGFGLGGGSILTIINQEKLKTVIRVTEKEIGYIRKGMEVIVRTDIHPDREFKGIVYAIEPMADVMSGTFSVIVSIDNRGGELKPGIIVRAEVMIQEKKDALVVPSRALIPPDILFVVKDGRADMRNVRLGIKTEDEFEVVEGVEEGEEVVIEGNIGLDRGVPVHVERVEG